MLPDDFVARPTTLTGGLDRALACWEACRAANPGGYGDGVVQAVRDWGLRVSAVTACSPFTAVATAMMFHKAGTSAAASSADRDGAGLPDPLDAPAADRVWSPAYDAGTTPLPRAFYTMSNGIYLTKDSLGDARARQLDAVLARLPADAPIKVARPDATARDVNRTSGALLFWNLGYEIEPPDMRRGDFVGIAWGHWGAHASFCWDVHLDAAGAVDCFQFVSANSGPGVSIAARDYAPWFATERTRAGTVYRATFDPLFADRELNVTAARWDCLPGVVAADVDRATFRAALADRNLIDRDAHPVDGTAHYYVRALRVIRPWGVAPPERAAAQASPLAATFPQAAVLAREAAPAPYAQLP